MGTDESSGEHGRLQKDLIARYQSLLDRLNLMLEHAKVGRWAEIIESEAEYLAELEHLRFMEADAEMDEAMQFHRARLGRAVLEQSAELKRYLTERRDVLANLISAAEEHAEDAERDDGSSEPEAVDEPEVPDELSHDPNCAKN